MDQRFVPTLQEIERRNGVMVLLVGSIVSGETIKLPPFEPDTRDYGRFSGETAGYRYQFEGEEDLLHLSVERLDGEPLSVEEAQQVVGFLYRDVPKALIWLKPGTYSHHFYIGHDELLVYLSEANSSKTPSQG